MYFLSLIVHFYYFLRSILIIVFILTIQAPLPELQAGGAFLESKPPARYPAGFNGILLASKASNTTGR